MSNCIAIGLGSAAQRNIGTGSGNVPVMPLVMSEMPQAKRRLDVHAFEVDIGSVAKRSGNFTVSSFEDLQSDTAVRVWQSVETGTGFSPLTDEAEMDQIQLLAKPINANTIRVHWLATGPVMGNHKFFYQIRSS